MTSEQFPPLRMNEQDGSPNIIPVYQIEVSNGTLTNMGGGKVRLATGAGGGGSVYASTGGSYITFSAETDLTAERTLVAGMGIAFADSGANSNLVIHPNTSLLVTSSRTISTVYPISGGGNLSLNRELAVDTAFLVNTGRTISAGAGLSGGGNLSADRTISLVTPVSVSSGGTGVTSISSNNLVYGGGTNALVSMATMHSGSLIVGSGNNLPPHIFGVGSQGQMLISDSSKLGALAWVNTAAGASSVVYAATGNQYVVMALAGDLTDERVLAAGTGLTLVDGGANGNATLAMIVPVSETSGGTGVSGMPRFLANINSAQTISANVDTKVNAGEEVIDTHGYYASGSFLPLIPGVYLIGAQVRWDTTEDQKRYRNALNFNGTNNFSNVIGGSGTADRTGAPLKLIRFNGTTDRVELNVEHDSATSKDLRSGADATIFFGCFVGS